MLQRKPTPPRGTTPPAERLRDACILRDPRNESYCTRCIVQSALHYHEPMTEPAPIREHALINLRYIREAMERASSFTSIPGWGGVAVGITAIAAAVIAHRFGLSRTWLLIWLGEAVVAAAIAGVTMVRKAARSQVSFRGAPARRFFISYFAPIVAGAALTIFLAKHGFHTALPAAWLLLYG